MIMDLGINSFSEMIEKVIVHSVIPESVVDKDDNFSSNISLKNKIFVV